MNNIKETSMLFPNRLVRSMQNISIIIDKLKYEIRSDSAY